MWRDGERVWAGEGRAQEENGKPQEMEHTTQAKKFHGRHHKEYSFLRGVMREERGVDRKRERDEERQRETKRKTKTKRETKRWGIEKENQRLIHQPLRG
jgi:hypothetical protein